MRNVLKSLANAVLVPAETAFALDPNHPFVAYALQVLDDDASADHAELAGIERRIEAIGPRLDAVRLERQRLADPDTTRAPDPARLAELDRQASELVAERDRLSERSREPRERWAGNGGAARTALDFVRQHRGRMVRPAVAPAPSHPTLTALEGIRQTLVENTDSSLALIQRPAPAADLRREMIASVDAIARRGAPIIDARIRGRDPAKIEEQLTLDISRAVVRGDGGASFLIWALHDQILARLLEPVPDLPDAISDADFASEQRRLAAERHDLDRREESLIRALRSAGQRVTRRHDCNPLALLQIEFVEDEA